MGQNRPLIDGKPGPEITGAIFDMDATLLDSMGIWFDAGPRYLRKKGIEPEENVHEAIATFNMAQVAAYFQEEYGVDEPAQDIIDGIEDLLADFYASEVEALPGVVEFLEELRRRGIPCCVATTTDRHLAEDGLRYTGIDGYFEFMLTCSELDTDKEHPLIFQEARRRLSTDEGTWVFEDAIHAIRTAHDAGFPICAVEETSMEPFRDEIKQLSDVYLPADFHAWRWAE
jgi:HAD superfamily hydrolase (TIGR01509 family)